MPWAEPDDHEGDDVIATLARTAANAHRTVTCHSGDRDLYQLLSDHTTVLTPARRRITAQEVTGRYAVHPRQWADYRALTGDPADAIPGIRGISPKTAAALLASEAHLEHLLTSPALTTARRQKIVRKWEQLLLWRDLIRLDTTVPLPTDPLTAQATGPLQRAAQILEHLGLW